MYYTGILLRDLKTWLKKGNKIYFKFHKQPDGNDIFFSLFNDYTIKKNIPFNELYDYISNVKKVTEEEYTNVYNEMSQRDYNTYSL